MKKKKIIYLARKYRGQKHTTGCKSTTQKCGHLNPNFISENARNWR